MKASIRVLSMLLTICMILTAAPIVSAANLDRLTYTIKGGQEVSLRTDIRVVQQYEVSVSETHTSGGSGLRANVIPDPDDKNFQVVILEGQLKETGIYKYTVTATYRDAFGQPNTKTQEVTIEVIKGYTDEVVKDHTNVGVNYKDKFEHGLPDNVKIDPDRPNTLELYGLTAAVDKDNLTITGTVTKAGTAQVTVSGVDEDGITSFYTVQITITTPDAIASTVVKTVHVGEQVNLQITHGLKGTPTRDLFMPNTLADYNLTATPGQGMLTISGRSLKPGTAEISFTDGSDRITVRLTIRGTDISSTLSYLELIGLKSPVEGELPVTSLSIDHKAIGVSNVQWTYVKDGEDVNWSHKKAFDLNEKYACYVTVNSAGGYTFDPGVYVYSGNITAEDVVINETADQLTVCFYFGYADEPIDYIEKVRIEDVQFPEAGDTVSDNLDALESGITVSGKSSLDYVTWSAKDDDGTLSSKTEFAGGTTYTCRMILECPKGSAFAADENGEPTVNVTINGDNAADLALNGDKLIVKYNYTVESKEPEWAPEVTCTPASIDCVTGDKRTITAEHNFPAGFTVSYQWFYNTKNSAENATALTGASSKTLTVPTNIEGTNYYYCVVSARSGNLQYESRNETLVRVTVGKSDYVFPFTDVPAGQWYRSSVEGAHKMGLINGKTDTLYKPDDNMKLVEAIKLAACMNQLHYSGKILLENGTPWYKPYVDYAKANGIISRDYTEAELNAAVTRAQYVDIFARALPDDALAAVNNIPDDSIPDVTSNSTYGPAIYKLYRAGILNGSDAKGTFGPSANIKRSAVAAILVRMMDSSYRVGAPAELGQ